MPTIIIHTAINADIRIVFDLARSIDLHKISTRQTQEEAIAGVTSGLISLGETVTWKAKHFGIFQKLTSKITEFEHPVFFVDEMEKGIFKRLRHEHLFKETDTGTLMECRFFYESPLGFLGVIADKLFLERYMTKFLEQRNQVIKEFAESDDWKTVLNHNPIH